MSASPPPPEPTQPPRALGIWPLSFVVVHLALRVHAGHPEDALWLCHVADLLLAIGLLARLPRVWAIGALWIVWGTPLWLLDVLGGGTFRPTSLGTHLGACAVALFAARRGTFPRGTHWRAILGVWTLLAVTRLLAPADGNLNLAFRVQEGWTDRFSSYPPYFVFVSAVCWTVFFATERGLVRAGGSSLSSGT